MTPRQKRINWINKNVINKAAKKNMLDNVDDPRIIFCLVNKI